MEEKSTNAATLNTEALSPEAKQVTQPGTTPAKAATVDVEAITKVASEKAETAAAKKMEAVFKSMLEQQGLDAGTITKMTDEWKSKQVTPDGTIAELTEKNEILTSEKAVLEKRFAAMEKGIPAELADKYVKLAEAYMDRGNASAALDAALSDFPVKTTIPTFTVPAGGGDAVNEDEFQKRINKPAKRGQALKWNKSEEFSEGKKGIANKGRDRE